MSGLLSVAKARELILSGVQLTPVEQVPLVGAAGRILGEDLKALRTQPPFPASAMDGYAVRADDVQALPATLRMIGESAAGHSFEGNIGPGECVRIFTGAPVPNGADTIVIQENVEANGNAISVLKGEEKGRYVRPAGLDFSKGDVLLTSGTPVSANGLSLAAAMNHPTLPVRRKPKVAIIASGDELMLPGSNPGPDQIIASNSFGVAAIVEQAGGEAIDLGIATDDLLSIEHKFQLADGADIVITLGGASVGDHDLIRDALEQRGVALDFWKLAMRPGKPVMFGTKNNGGKTTRYIGLPGNPVSSLVCALVFIVPLIRAHLGLGTQEKRLPAVLAIDLPENDQREEYMRSTYEERDGVMHVTPFESQDSSRLALLSKATCLMIRPAHAKAAKVGDPCEVILI